MHINAVCPACENTWRVQPSLRGQPMRCPNPDCRTVFTVPAEEPPAATKAAPPRPQPPNGRRTGTVGDVVPLVRSEAVETNAKTAPSWQEPPPVRRPAKDDTPPTQPAAPLPAADGPREMPPGAWEPPPVRRGPAAAPAPTVEPPAEPTPDQTPAEPAAADEPVYHPPARRVGLLVALFALFAVVAVGGIGFYLWHLWSHTEGAMAREADDTYQRGQFSQAAYLYKQLADQFPASDKHDSYVLMQGLSDLRGQASAPQPELSAVLDQFFSFIEGHKDQEQALKERAPDLGETVVRLAEGYADRNRETTDEQGTTNAVVRLEKAFDASRAGPELGERLHKATDALRARVALVRRTRESVARIRAAATGSASQRVRNVIHQLREEEAQLPNIDKNPEVVEIVKQVYANHIAGVKYERNEEALPSARRENDEATFVVSPRLRGAPAGASEDRSVVLALARGVLYGLNPATGRWKWAVRVGVDATSLPVRVPPTEASPERFLVPSADSLTLAALDAEGGTVWEYRLSGQCIGRPLVIGNLAYVPTYDGKVHEIELAQGKLLGVYDLGQPLTSGGAAQPGKDLLYFPADDFCVYVIDAKAHRCVSVLYTGHPAGSLRGEPLILTPDPEAGESWLVLNQTRGLDAMQLRVYRLPIQDREQPPEKLVPEPPLPGWTWFPPSHDGEKAAMLSDDGVLGLFGIRQARNLLDPALFPMLPKNPDLASAGRKEHGRSEVVEMRGQDLCLLADGRLRRFYLELNAAAGPRLEPAANWDAPKALDSLGSPLHASQVRVRPDDGATLVLVTRPLTRQTCLATAVDDDEGEILWQRQLGLVCRGEPVGLRPAGGGAPVLLALDRGGGLFAFDPAKYADLADGQWREAGQKLFDSLDDGPGGPPVLLPAADGRTAYEIATPGDGKKLYVRRVEWKADGPAKAEWEIPLSSPLAGTPAVTDSMIVLPLAKGVLARLTLPLADKPAAEEGPNWRARRAPPDAVGRVADLGDGTFVAYDGARGLTHWQWAKAKEFTAFPAGKDAHAPTLALENSLTADPLLLPGGKDSPPRLCVADAAGVVTLLTVTGDGGLKKGRSWNVGGRVTSGPYAQTLPDGGVRVGCVVEGKQLIWLDPASEKIVWTRPATPGAALVGRPRLAGGLVVVADESGLIVGLDPATGKPGPEYRLHGSVAPAAGPVGFGADRLFAPLSDGTVLLPPASRIR